jgi:hypothetical protein
MPKVQGTVMVDELVLLYRGMGQHDKALDVRDASLLLSLEAMPLPLSLLRSWQLSIRLLWLCIGRTNQLQVIVNKNTKESAQEAKQYCLDNAPPCKPGEVPESLFTDLLRIYFNSEDPKYAAASVLADSLTASPSTHR